jgi:Tfp pilus assembly protein FimV
MSNKKTVPTPVTVVEPAIVETVAETAPVVETPAVAPVAPVKAAPAKPETYVAVDGDTFASIAARFKPEGISKHGYAVHLSLLNSGTLRPGSEVKL